MSVVLGLIVGQRLTSNPAEMVFSTIKKIRQEEQDGDG